MATALDTERLKHDWKLIRHQVREHWGQLTDDDLVLHGGNVEQLINRLHKATGATTEEIEDYLSGLLYGSSLPGARSAVEAREWMGRRAAQAARQVRRRPTISVATAMGLGMVAGIAVGLMLRRR